MTSASPGTPAGDREAAEQPLVLIVDDNEQNLKLAREVLRAGGCEQRSLGPVVQRQRHLVGSVAPELGEVHRSVTCSTSRIRICRISQSTPLATQLSLPERVCGTPGAAQGLPHASKRCATSLVLCRLGTVRSRNEGPPIVFQLLECRHDQVARFVWNQRRESREQLRPAPHQLLHAKLLAFL